MLEKLINNVKEYQESPQNINFGHFIVKLKETIKPFELKEPVAKIEKSNMLYDCRDALSAHDRPHAGR